jgi:hypothetical protein
MRWARERVEQSGQCAEEHIVSLEMVHTELE